MAEELLHPHAAGDIYVPYLKGGLLGFTQGRGGEPPTDPPPRATSRPATSQRPSCHLGTQMTCHLALYRQVKMNQQKIHIRIA